MWYEDWFGRDEYELVYHERGEAEAERMVDLLERVARPAAGAAVLDVGCGRGRHARVLARRGYRVTGIDLSEDVLAQARTRADDEGLVLTFRRSDMREPACDACFDGVINLFTTFGYFEDEADHLRAVRAMAAALRPGGWLFQDFLNASYVRSHLVPEDAHVHAGVEIRQQRWIADGRIGKRITLHDRHAPRNGTRGPFFESVRLLTLDDFRALYAAAGLTLSATFGDDDGAPHGPASPRLILYAHKR